MNFKGLYVGVLILLLMMLLLSLGSGFWGGNSTGLHFTERLFSGVCHQLPDRSFYINGGPMAVNSRCFGVFLGLFVSWMLIPVFRKFPLKQSNAIIILLFAVMLQIIDYTGNLFEVWENTNNSRAVLGGILGLVSFLVIADLFQPQKNRH